MASWPDESGSLVVLTGRVDVSTATVTREVLHRAVDRGAGRLVIDLSGVEIVDATGLGVLAGTQRRATHAGRTLVLRGVPTRVAWVLRRTRLGKILLGEYQPASVA